MREHFPAPRVSSHDWKLSISGVVGAPVEISYDDLVRQARKTLAVTLECAENPAGGGLVSHAEWGGVSMASLLERAQNHPEARYARLVGADGYSRTIPIAKALHADTLLAVTMNGERLPPVHGFPVRALVPGWYGMDSVKWLQAIEMLPSLEGAHMTHPYRRRVRSLLLGGEREGDPITAMNVKSAFSRPTEAAILGGRRFTVRGAAWAGQRRVRTVEVSTDGSKTWQAARFAPVGPPAPQPYAWVHWEYNWAIPGPGSYALVCRATDEDGVGQPAERPGDRVDTYEWNTWQMVRVSVA